MAKKGISGWGIAKLLIGLACVFFFFFQPIKLISEDSIRYTVHFGKKVDLVMIAEYSGGYRCYVNDTEYFWVSAGECFQRVGEKLQAEFKTNGTIVLYRGDT